jgi:hypothetical protein
MCETFDKNPTFIKRLTASDGTEYLYRGIWTPQVGELYLDGARICVSREDYPDTPRSIWVKVHKGVSNVYTSNPSPSMSILEAAIEARRSGKRFKRLSWPSSLDWFGTCKLHPDDIIATDWIVG